MSDKDRIASLSENFVHCGEESWVPWCKSKARAKVCRVRLYVFVWVCDDYPVIKQAFCSVMICDFIPW